MSLEALGNNLRNEQNENIFLLCEYNVLDNEGHLTGYSFPDSSDDIECLDIVRNLPCRPEGQSAPID